MKRYRIIVKKTTWQSPKPNDPYVFEPHCFIGYIPQKRFLGCLWWTNIIDDIGYESLDDAKAALMKEMFQENEQIVLCEY